MADFLHAYQEHFELNPDITTRDRDGVQKTFSGLMKVLFPHGSCTKQETAELLSFALESRRRVKEQILKLDETFAPVTFSYTDRVTQEEHTVLTLEEKQYPALARRTGNESEPEVKEPLFAGAQVGETATKEPAAGAKPGHLVVPENSKGFSFRRLFAEYLRGARQVTVLDPYVRAFWQIRNFMELVQLVHDLTPVGEETTIRLVTKSDSERCIEQDQNLRKIQESCLGSRVHVDYVYENGDTFHARSISTDTGWKISLDRGLDIYQRYEISLFTLASVAQDERQTKAFEVTYLRTA
jgi:ATP-dependent Lon protease